MGEQSSVLLADVREKLLVQVEAYKPVVMAHLAHAQNVTLQYYDVGRERAIQWAGHVNTTEVLQRLESPDAVWTKLGQFAPFLPPVVVTYVVMVTLAVVTVYFGSISTVLQPKSASKPDKSSKLYHPVDLKSRAREIPTVSTSDAYRMPLVAGTALVGLYVAIKYMNELTLQTVLMWYFGFVSFLAVLNVASDTLQGIVRVVFNGTLPHWRLTLASDPEYHHFDLSIEETEEARKELFTAVRPQYQSGNLYWSLGEVFGLVFSSAVLYVKHVYPNWLVDNVVSTCLAVWGIATVRIGSFKTGFVMLAGLFAYDIFFVFGTDVMMTVATKIDGPIKLQVPRPPMDAEIEAGKSPKALLGLGDIVIPAMFISLCLRYDLERFYANNRLPFHVKRSVPRPYFWTTMVAYVVGLVVTIVVMTIYEHGQPALLYLCPSVALSTLLLAAIRGDLTNLFSFDESPEEKDDKKDDIVKEEKGVKKEKEKVNGTLTAQEKKAKKSKNGKGKERSPEPEAKKKSRSKKST